MDPFKTTIIRGTVMERTENKKSLGRRAFLKTAALSGALTGSLTLAQTGGAGEAQAARGRKRGTVPMKKLGATGASIPIMQLGTAQRLDQTYDRLLHGCFKGGVTGATVAASQTHAVPSEHAVKTRRPSGLNEAYCTPLP